ncbi:VCBS repeat-containing protein [Rheinheimera sp. UJ51]|uniref:FG-GAP repeat domain-containing protein n=1 Tax=Rheinheimera sp. UJ51 TaxID=2892446 RepID=UPI001E61AEA1|nr:VCBS repeat-containing protein [Rheinheimera sp. UJ51]MCC5452062.1 VCBS repeat-containing protein [Rheinheimera sp. UJ51]
MRFITALGIWITLAIPGIYAPFSAAFEMDRVHVALNHPANGSIMMLQGQNQLLVSGFSQFERWLTLVELEQYQTLAVPIPANAQFFSKARLVGYEAEQLVFLTADGIVHYQQASAGSLSAGRFQPLLASSSMFRVIDEVRLRERQFALDLGSGRSDFLIADFQHMHLYRQQADGQFVHYALPVSARIQTWGNNRADYSGRRHYAIDVDQDGLLDLVFVQQGRFSVFLQQADGSFALEPYYPSWPVLLSTERQADQRSDAGRSYSGQNITTLEDITDLDGDGLPDLVLNVEQIADALERSSRFQIFFGRAADDGVTYPTVADTEISIDSVPTEVVIGDFNGDGRKDFYIPTTKIGVGTIVRVLLRGSANLDVDFYLLSENRSYAAKADFRQQAKIDVSISNLRFDMPLFKLIDVNGDGRKSLLLGEGGNELRFFAPDGSRLFKRNSDKVQMPLPRDASRVQVIDLNGDNKEDLVLPFDSLDDAELRNQLILLFSR